MSQDYYSILGVAKTATAAEIRTAYLKLARDNHPDKFSDEEREEAGQRFQQITEAFNHLRDEKLRQEYDKSLDRKERPPEEEAKLYFKNAQLQEQSQEYGNALKFYYEAMRLQPQNLDYVLGAARLLARGETSRSGRYCGTGGVRRPARTSPRASPSRSGCFPDHRR